MSFTPHGRFHETREIRADLVVQTNRLTRLIDRLHGVRLAAAEVVDARRKGFPEGMIAQRIEALSVELDAYARAEESER